MKRILPILYAGMSSVAFGQQIDIPFLTGNKSFTFTYDYTQSALNAQFRKELGAFSFQAGYNSKGLSESVGFRSKSFMASFSNLPDNRIIALSASRLIGRTQFNADYTTDKNGHAANFYLNKNDTLFAYHNSKSQSVNSSSVEITTRFFYTSYDNVGNYNVRVNNQFAVGRINKENYYETSLKNIYVRYQGRDVVIGIRNIKISDSGIGLDYHNSPDTKTLGVSLNSRKGFSATAGYNMINERVGVISLNYSCKF